MYIQFSPFNEINPRSLYLNEKHYILMNEHDVSKQSPRHLSKLCIESRQRIIITLVILKNMVSYFRFNIILHNYNLTFARNYTFWWFSQGMHYLHKQYLPFPSLILLPHPPPPHPTHLPNHLPNRVPINLPSLHHLPSFTFTFTSPSYSHFLTSAISSNMTNRHPSPPPPPKIPNSRLI